MKWPRNWEKGKWKLQLEEIAESEFVVVENSRKSIYYQLFTFIVKFNLNQIWWEISDPTITTIAEDWTGS